MAKSKSQFINVKIDPELKKALLKIKGEKQKEGEKATLNELVTKAVQTYVNRVTA